MKINYKKIKKDGFIPQGYVIIDNLSLISAYKKYNKSRIYIFDNKMLEYKGFIKLNNNHHVGGITYDDINKILILTGKRGTISTYNYKRMLKEFINDNYNFEITDKYIIENNINLHEQISTTYFYKGILYSSTFENVGKLFKTIYIFEKGSIKEVSTTLYSIPNISAIQGLGIKNNYLLISSSIGKLLPSRITVYKINDNFYHKIYTKVLMKPGLQGISINKNEVYGVFEYGKYELKRLTTMNDLIEKRNILKLTNLFYLIANNYIKKKYKKYHE